MKRGRLHETGKSTFGRCGQEIQLITVYGLECIQKADVIAYDRLVNPKLLNYAKENAELIYCGKSPGKHHLIQEEIHALLVEKALEGKTVTRLKGGDPFVFGRGGEEAEVLAANGIEYEIVPGVTAGIAAPAYAGIPVTHREHASSYAIVTGHGRDSTRGKITELAGIGSRNRYGSLLHGSGKYAFICQQLIVHGRDAETPVAIIEWGTTKKQRTITGDLETIDRFSGKRENSESSNGSCRRSDSFK